LGLSAYRKKVGQGAVKSALVVALALYFVFYPSAVFSASIRGLQAWWQIVFPALLPFFVLSEILVGLGVVHMLGVLLEPLMRPLFQLPGSGAYVIALAHTSGSPIGAVAVARLRKQNLLSREEAECLVAFTNNASPLFMLVAIPVGMLGQPAVGTTIALSHYLANMVIGLFLGLWRRFTASCPPAQPPYMLIRRSLRALVKAQQEDGRPLGKMLGDAIRNSLQTLFTIGGFIIVFSVFIQILDNLGLIVATAKLLELVLIPAGFAPETLHGIAAGMVEMTIGLKEVADTQAPLFQQVLAISLILGWSGLSIQSQVFAILADTDIRLKLFVLCRAMQAILSTILAVLLLRYPVLWPVSTIPTASPWLYSLTALKAFAGLLAILVLAGLFRAFLQNRKC